MSWDSDDTVFEVVINEQDQYSIWPQYLERPAGWSAVGKSGTKPECLHYITEHWTDMRPRSLRLHMEAEAAGGAVATAGVERS